MAISPNSLKIFINVADSGSITRTAAALFISQPAVSKAIKSIEEELGVTLFYRDKKSGLKLTDTGERILGYARRMMLMEEKIYQTAYQANNMLEGTLRIASLPIGIDHILVKALAAYNEKYPHVSVEILEGSGLDVNKMVSDHEAEFGISLAPADGFQKETLIEDHIVAISRDELDDEVIDLEQSKRQFVICRAAMEVLQPELSANVTASGNFKVVSSTTVRLMTREGLGVGVQSELLMSPYRDWFHVYPVVPDVRTDLVLIANDFDDLSPAASAFVEIIRQMKNEA